LRVLILDRKFDLIRVNLPWKDSDTDRHPSFLESEGILRIYRRSDWFQWVVWTWVRVVGVVGEGWVVGIVRVSSARITWEGRIARIERNKRIPVRTYTSYILNLHVVNVVTNNRRVNGLSNIGTWFIGRLQTAQDKERVISGLSGIGSNPIDKSVLMEKISNLKKRNFLVKNINEDVLRVIETRFALSYLKGPLSNEQISNLMKEQKERRKKKRED